MCSARLLPGSSLAPEGRPVNSQGCQPLVVKTARSFSPGGAAVNSQGCQPLGRTERWFFLFSPGGAATRRPSGAKRPRRASPPGAAPLAINCRPSGAKNNPGNKRAEHYWVTPPKLGLYAAGWPGLSAGKWGRGKALSQYPRQESNL